MVDNWSELFKKIEHNVLEGHDISFGEALSLTEATDDAVEELAAVASRVRQHFCRESVDLCSIINARSGKCSEDCKFCSQSRKYATNSPSYPMKTVDEIVIAAKTAESNGAHRFCIVSSGETLADRDFDIVLEAVRRIRNETGLNRCASVGSLTSQRANSLKDAGLNRYHHNIETARSFFPAVCSTHTYDDKIETIDNLKNAAIETCVGGILNLGESPVQRLEFAFELKDIEPDSIPINFLNPRAGTPLAEQPPMAALEAAKYLAIFRLILPRTSIRLAGGRQETFKERPELPFSSGANALLIGDLLTTKGPAVKSDLNLLESLGFNLTPAADDKKPC